MNNFCYFSMMYLNDWIYWDKPFIERISNTNKTERIKGLHDAAKYYKVTRNFKIITEDMRFEKALGELDLVNCPSNAEEAISTVNALSVALMNVYGKNALSAASKFLWLKFKSPILIYDSRAYEWLKARGYQVATGDYASYYHAWNSAYSEVESDIDMAAKDLYKVKEYSQAFDYKDQCIRALTSEHWFKERIFDKYLWFNAGNG
ncbi:hypothetical protein MID13_19105 [Vibrio gigantis]|uniref:hypothetical protein n=1 Tax=Vibrio gigantis TaxID=296199 RepID=UPI001EFBB7AD|nr:hypothetical protein [Vibrio gigantis]ULN67218.1 hypothetical protein MID13_19105 [Vibrio gigantis]